MYFNIGERSIDMVAVCIDRQVPNRKGACGARDRESALPMQSTLPVLDGEVETGEDFQPSEDHPGWRVQGANPGEGPVVSTQNKRPVSEVIFIVLKEEDYRK